MGNHDAWFVMTLQHGQEWPDLDGPFPTEQDANKWCDRVRDARERRGWTPVKFMLEQVDLQTFTTITYRNFDEQLP